MGGGDEMLGRGTLSHLGGAPGEDLQAGQQASPPWVPWDGPPAGSTPRSTAHLRTSWGKGLRPTPAPSRWPPAPGKAHMRAQVAWEGLDTGSRRRSSRLLKAPARCPAPSALCTTTGARPVDCLSPRKAQTQMGPVLLRGLLPKVPAPVSPSRPHLGRAGGFSFPLAAL